MDQEQRLKQANRLIDEFKTMRDLQKEYFKTRKNDVLVKSKQQEKIVDEMITDYFTDKSQTKLF